MANEDSLDALAAKARVETQVGCVSGRVPHPDYGHITRRTEYPLAICNAMAYREYLHKTRVTTTATGLTLKRRAAGKFVTTCSNQIGGGIW